MIKSGDLFINTKTCQTYKVLGYQETDFNIAEMSNKIDVCLLLNINNWDVIARTSDELEGLQIVGNYFKRVG